MLTSVLLLLAACGSDTQDAGSTDPTDPATTPDSTSAESGELDAIKIGVPPTMDAASLYLGINSGIFEEHGLDVEVVPQEGGAPAIAGVVSGSLDFAFTNVFTVIVSRAQGVPIRIVANGGQAGTGPEDDTSGVMVPEGSDIQEPADLVGTTIGVNVLNTVIPITIRECMETQGLDSSTVNFTEIPFPEMALALDRGDLDVVAPVEPFTSQIVATGGSSVMAPFACVEPRLPVVSYVVGDDYSQSNPEIVDRFMQAMAESNEHAEANPEDLRAVIPEYTQVPAEVAATARLPFYGAEIPEDGIGTLMDLAIKYGAIDEPVALDELMYAPGR